MKFFTMTIIRRRELNYRGEIEEGTQRQKNRDKIATCTCQVFGQVRVVHEAVARKLDTLESDWDVNVIEPGGGKKITR